MPAEIVTETRTAQFFFAELCGGGKQAIVETHSEYFLKRISALITAGKLEADRVGK